MGGFYAKKDYPYPLRLIAFFDSETGHYLLLAYVKYQSRYQQSLFCLHRVIKETLLQRAKIIDLLRLNDRRLKRIACQDPQLCLQL